MKQYTVIADALTGKKSRSYKKGDIVTAEYLVTNPELLVSAGQLKPLAVSDKPAAGTNKPAVDKA